LQDGKNIVPANLVALLPHHSLVELHDEFAIEWFARDNDYDAYRLSDDISTSKCMLLNAFLLEKGFDGFRCTWCPVGAANRANAIYTDAAPYCQAKEHTNVLTACWFARFLSVSSDSRESIARLPVPEWPELINAKTSGSKKHFHNKNSTLGE
jgi:hypothetical protein